MKHHTSLRGGTTKQSSVSRAALQAEDCFVPRNDVRVCHAEPVEAWWAGLTHASFDRFRMTVLFICMLVIAVNHASAQTNDLKLWYKQPAVKWTDALPIANGRLGGMIFGGVEEDRIQFNENTLWTGGPRQYQRGGAYLHLATIRQLLFDGKQKEAEDLAGKSFMGLRSGEFSYAADSAKWVEKVIDKGNPNFTFLRGFLPINLPTEQGWETTPGLEGLDGAVW